MAQLPDQQWIIEVNARPTGPFSIDQIRGLLKERQILPSFRVKKKSQNDDSWTTIAELIKSTENFSPPPRPQKSDEGVTQINTPRSGLQNDATENLFETIQSVKEKNTFTARTKPKIELPKIKSRWGGPILILFGITVTALCFTLWSAFKIVQLSQSTRVEPVTAPATPPPVTQTKPTSSSTPNRDQHSARSAPPQQRVVLPSSAKEGGQIEIYSERPSVHPIEPLDRVNPVQTGRARPKDRYSENSRTDEDPNASDEDLPPESDEDPNTERDQINNEGVAPNSVDSQ